MSRYGLAFLCGFGAFALCFIIGQVVASAFQGGYHRGVSTPAAVFALVAGAAMWREALKALPINKADTHQERAASGSAQAR